MLVLAAVGLGPAVFARTSGAGIHLGTGYCPAGWNVGQGTLEVNPKTFDRPKEDLQVLHDQHFKVVLHKNRVPRNLFGASDLPGGG